MTRSIILIHGAWLNGESWGAWKPRYEAKGYSVTAPSWPYDDRPVAELNASPDPRLAKSGHKDIIAHYAALIRALPEPPILIGHSFGGVLVQHLLDDGLGAAGAAINPAPTPGVPLGPQAVISALPVLIDPFSFRGIKRMSRGFFGRRFAQTLSKEEADVAYPRYVAPTAGKVYWDGIVEAAGQIDWESKVRPPLLIVTGGKDLIADASMAKKIYEKQKKAASATEFKLYPDRSHWTCMDRGWEEVADFVLDWTVRQAG
jgi:pimeloyl-ACP methyl ester carboxylesterase